MPGSAVLATRLALAHACCLSCAKQDGLRYLAFLFRRVEIAIRAFSRCWRGYLPLWVHFGFGRFFVAISTGLPGTRGTGLAARHLCAFAQAHWLCYAFRGEYVGAPRPKPAPKSLRLSGLSSRCGGVMLVRIRARRHPGIRVDPPGSDLWPGGSCCIVLSFLALRGSKWNRHCRRAAPKRRRVGLRARSGVAVGTADRARSGVRAGSAC